MNGTAVSATEALKALPVVDVPPEVSRRLRRRVIAEVRQCRRDEDDDE